MATQTPLLEMPHGYRTQADDTGIEMDRYCFNILRQKTVSERLQMGAQLTRSARQFAIDCFHQRFSHLTPQQFARKLAEAWLQEHCPDDYVPGGSELTWVQDSIQLATDLHTIFAAEGIIYYVTGGVAAIAYGESRTTQDLDVVLYVDRDNIPELAAILEKAGFYVPGVEDVASGRMRTLQITQVDTIYRADLVIADFNAYEQLKFERRSAYTLSNGIPIYLASPEDVVVNKLRWGQRSQSDKQWRDVLGVLKTQQGDLDYEYMHHWAAEFDLSEALERATLAAGVRAIADQQWAKVMHPIISRAFELAHSRNRVEQVSPGVEIADGARYTLIRDASQQTFTVIAKIDDRAIAQYDLEGMIWSASPSLQDRRQWQTVAQWV
ncbi:MAG: hypothetical protein AAFW75_11605 [Cyanobacteria bacterium J06636_16]